MRKWFLALIPLIASCVTTGAPPAKTQLQIRETQTRTFDTQNTKPVMKALINVLQDDGYSIKNADADLGFISAMKETDIESSGDAFWAKFGHHTENARWKKTRVIEATVNVGEFGKECRVRASFQEKILDNLGGIMSVKQIDDGKFYQEFFSKADKGLFLQKEKL